MGLPQGEISKIEHRQDVYLSTLRRFIEAMGGELVLAARFPDGELPIQIGDREAMATPTWPDLRAEPDRG